MPSKTISAKLASILLLRRGELSINEIMALPFVEDVEEASLIMTMLALHFDADIEQRRVASSVLPEWEDIILLRQKPEPIRKNKGGQLLSSLLL